MVRLQQQVEELRKHWQKTHEQEHAEYEKQLQRKEQRNQELQMQIGSNPPAHGSFQGTNTNARRSRNNLEIQTHLVPSA